VKVSDSAREMMKESGLIKYVPSADEKEHSLEIQLPFLQRILGEFELTPLVLGELSEQECEELAALLIKRLDEETLIVASTDLSHYFHYDTAVEMDRDCIDSIVKLNVKKAEGCQMCGMNPVLVLMTIAKKLGWKTRLLKYENSGDVTGDITGVVGYAAIAFYI
jgi:AmmeMemoRadiSam system protein B